MKRHIILLGMTGAGKSTVGEKLAPLLGYPLVETDVLIEKKTGATIADIFASHGEPFFRQLEQEVLQTALAGDDGVIATGGGVVLAAENRRVITAGGWAVYLQTPIDVLLSRLRDDQQRPLLKHDMPAALTQMAAAREPLYEKIAHLSVMQTARDNPTLIAQKIYRGLQYLMQQTNIGT